MGAGEDRLQEYPPPRRCPRGLGWFLADSCAPDLSLEGRIPEYLSVLLPSPDRVVFEEDSR